MKTTLDSIRWVIERGGEVSISRQSPKYASIRVSLPTSDGTSNGLVWSRYLLNAELTDANFDIVAFWLNHGVDELTAKMEKERKP